MNRAQFFSHLRSALKLGGAWLVTHNYLGSTTANWAVGLAVAALGFVWSHLFHSPVPPDDSQPSLPLRCLLVVTAAGLLAGTVGCTSMDKVIAQLKDDPAIVAGSVMTPYGSMKFTRVGSRTNETITVGGDGTITVKTP